MNRLYRIYPLLLVISAFCPYVIKSLGVKAEHLIIFPILLLTIFIAIMNRVKICQQLVPFVYLWLGLLVFVAIRSFLSNDSAGTMALSDLGNFMMPFCVMLFYLFNFNREKDNEQEVINKVIRLFNFFLILNSCLIIISFMGFDISSILQFYWKGSVAENSLSNGRYTGLFNQPMESGLAYSLGILGWLYVIEKQNKVSFMNMIYIVLLLIGGIASVSKVFIVGGILLFTLGVVRNKGVRKSFIKLLIFLTPLVYAVYYILNEKWSGMQYLTRFLTNDNSGNLLDNLTAGRFGGGNSTMKSLFGDVWEQHPIIGLGLGNNPVYDSQWFQAFGAGGIIAFTIMLIFVLLLLWKTWEYHFIKDARSESRLFGSLVILCVLSSIGAPIFTLNRSSIVMWALLGLLLAHKNKTHIPTESQPSHSTIKLTNMA